MTRWKKLELKNTLVKPLTTAIIGALVVAVAVFGYPYYQRTRNDTPPVVAAPAPPAVETPAPPVAAAPAEEAPAAPVTEAPWTYSGQTMSLTGILGVAAILFLIVSLRVLRWPVITSMMLDAPDCLTSRLSRLAFTAASRYVASKDSIDMTPRRLAACRT